MSQKEKPTASRPSDSAIHEPDELSSTSEPTSDSGPYFVYNDGDASAKAHKNVVQSAQSRETPHGELVVTPNPSASIHQNQGVEEAQSCTGVEDKHTSHSPDLTPSHAFPETHPPPSSEVLKALPEDRIVTSSTQASDIFISQASTTGSTPEDNHDASNHLAAQPLLPVSSSNSNNIQGTTTPDLSRSDSSSDSTQSVLQPPVSESTSFGIAEKELDALKSENEDLKNRLLVLHAKLEKIYDLQSSKNEEIRRLSEEVNELKLHIAKIEKSAQERETKIVESKDYEILDLKSTIKSMKFEQSNLNEKYFDKLLHRIEELRRIISEKEQEISDLKEKIKELTDDCSKLTADRKKQADRRDQQVKHQKATEEELKRRKNELKTIQSLLEEKESLLEKKESEIKSLKEKKEKLAKEQKSSRKDQDLFLRYLKLFD